MESPLARRARAPLLLSLALGVGPTLVGAEAGGLDPAKVNVCLTVPGAAVAAAVGGELREARPFTSPGGEFARCTYIVSPRDPANGTAAGYVLWLYRAEAYDELLAVTEGPQERVEGLGDAAILFQDDDERWKLRFVRRGRYSAEATAADAGSTRKLARLAFEKL